MLKRQRNLVFEILRENCEKHQLNLSDFALEEGAFNFEYAVNYRKSDWQYRVIDTDNNKGGQVTLVKYKPAATDSLTFSTRVFSVHFSDTTIHIDDWIEALAYEENALDLWDEFLGIQTTSTLKVTNNESLTREEQNKALRAIEEVKARILELESGNEEAKEELKAHIDTHFTHLKEAVTRVGKKDYVLMFQATVFNVITGWMLSPESRSAIWLFAMEQIRIQLIPDMVIPGLPN